MSRRPSFTGIGLGIIGSVVLAGQACRKGPDEVIDPARVSSPQRPAPPPNASGTPMLMDPKDLLFSLPTLCDLAPPVVPVTAGLVDGGAFVLHEDDWRQVEFVAKADHAAVARMLDEVRASATRNRVGLGWKNVYLRKDHATPIRSLSLTKQQVRIAFGTSEAQPVVLSSGGSPVGQVRGGFAVAVPGLGTLYGHADGETVTALGIVPVRARIDEASRGRLSMFSDAHGLEIVDWERRDWVDPKLTLWGSQ